MPIIKAAVKALRQTKKRTAVNRGHKRKLKEALKEIKKFALEKRADDFKKKLPEVMSIIDKAVKHHLIHKNNAARKKSALAKLIK